MRSRVSFMWRARAFSRSGAGHGHAAERLVDSGRRRAPRGVGGFGKVQAPPEAERSDALRLPGARAHRTTESPVAASRADTPRPDKPARPAGSNSPGTPAEPRSRRHIRSHTAGSR